MSKAVVAAVVLGASRMAPAPTLPATPVPGLNLPARAALPGEGGERAFYERVFAGEAPAALPDPELVRAKADIVKLLDYLCEQRPGWKSADGLARALADRLHRVEAHGGIPRTRPKGLFGSETVVERLHADALAQIQQLAQTVWAVAKKPNRDFGELFYSVGKLAERAESREKLRADLAWLYGTYRW